MMEQFRTARVMGIIILYELQDDHDKRNWVPRRVA